MLIIKSYTKTEKIYSPNKGYINGKILFNDDCVLSFMELKNITKETKDKYSYHFMDEKKKLIFRYDNTEYHTEISTFPHHKHLENSIVEASEPELINVLIEIYKLKYQVSTK